MRRQPDFSTTPSHDTLRPRWEGLLVLAAVVAAALCATTAYRARAEAREATTRAVEARRQLDDQQARLRAVAPAAGEVAPGASEAPPGRIVGAIAGLLPGDARLSRVSIAYGRVVSVEMQVDARRAAAWDRLLERIERSPQFVEVEPGPEDREAEVNTTLRARWAGGGR